MCRLLTWAAGLVVFFCLGPLIAGVGGLLLPAWGYYPALGSEHFSWRVWEQLLAWPGLLQSVWLSVMTGLTSTLLALLVTFTTLSLLWQSRLWSWLSLYLAPALALPHVAFAIGFGFLIAPGGFLARGLATLLGWSDPPLWMTVNDPDGLALIAMLVIKEVPFLLLMSIGILQQLRPGQQLLMARSLGYDPVQAWWKVLIPQLYGKLKLPIFAVLVYGVTVVDAALIIGPQLPPPLSVVVLRWFQHGDLNYRMLASAGGLLLLVITVGLLGLWSVMDRLMIPVVQRIWVDGRKRIRHPLLWLARAVLPLLALASLGANVVLLIWSFAGQWRFPEFLPLVITLANWQSHWAQLADPLFNAFVLALVSSSLSVLACLVLLEFQHQRERYWSLMFPCMALLLPQMSLFTGLPILLDAVLGQYLSQHYFLVVGFGHLLMVFPFVYLGMHGAFQAFDRRYQTVALTLGASQNRAFWGVKVAMLKSVIISSWAVGFSVSVVQYLPTLLLGAGRVVTITTETVAVGSGYDHRTAAVFGLSQALLPLLFFLLAHRLNQHKAWH